MKALKMLLPLLACIILWTDADAQDDIPVVEDESTYEAYVSMAGGIGWADGSQDGDFTLGGLVFYHINSPELSLMIAYEGDAEAMGSFSTDVPEDQWAKLGVAYRSSSQGLYGAFVREGAAYEGPGTGFEAGYMLSAGENWDSFLTVSYTYIKATEGDNSARVGFFGRVLD